MNHSYQLLDKVKTGLGVIEGLWMSASTLTLTATVGAARVGQTTAEVAALANKATNGMNLPGIELEVQTPLTVVMPHNATRLVWLKTDGTLALTADLASGQTYRDVAPELEPDVFSGALIDGLNISQKGPLRETQPASVLLGVATSSPDSATVTFSGVFDSTETSTITIGGTAVVTTSTVNGTTAANQAAAALASIQANATANAKVTVTISGAVLTLASKDATAYTLTASDTAAAGAAAASGNLAGSVVSSFSNLRRTKVLIGNGTM